MEQENSTNQQLSPEELVLIQDFNKDLQLLELKQSLAVSELNGGKLSLTNLVLKLYIKYGLNPENHQLDFATGKFTEKETK